MPAIAHTSTLPECGTRRVDPVSISAAALASLAILALHIADDSFLQPEPGTSPFDHLAGGFVPLGALGLAAFAYPRARAGLRASIAVVAGLFALVVGAASAGYGTITVGPSGDDFTGLLVLPAGLALLAVGAATLWTSRKRDRRLRRYMRRALIVIVAALAINFVIFPIGFSYVITHVMRQTVPQAKLGAAYESVTFRTRDGLDLRGWYVPSQNGAAVIAFPGRRGPITHARMLARHGYGVLLFDRRGEGESDGDSNLLGWGGDRDILAAVAFLQHRPDVDPNRIGGIGLSVGGELMLQAAAETGGLAAVVSEGAGTRMFSEQMEEYHGFRRALIAMQALVLTGGTAVFASTPPPPNLTDLAPRITQPLFVIWAPNGGNVEHMSRMYYRLARGPKQIWAMPTARHVGGIYDQPEEYERRVTGFFDRALLSGS